MSRCRGCGAPISWDRTEAGKWIPMNPDGTTHFATCPKSSEFRVRSKVKALLRADPLGAPAMRQSPRGSAAYQRYLALPFGSAERARAWDEWMAIINEENSSEQRQGA